MSEAMSETSCKTLWAIVMTLTYTFREIESHWRVLSKVMIIYTLSLMRITLVSSEGKKHLRGYVNGPDEK